MLQSKSIRSVLLVSTLSLGLAACDQAQDLAGDLANAAGAGEMNIADGHDVCFQAAKDKLDADAKVSEISTMFSAGTDVDGDETIEAGGVEVCNIFYQDPEDPRKLVGLSYNGYTKMFSGPDPVEMSVSGDPEDFNLEDYLIPLSEVDPAPIAQFMADNDAALAEKFSSYAWTTVSFEGVGSSFQYRVGYEGRLKSNDMQDDGFAILAADGTTVVDNNLFD
ncbi:hypothetical protein [Erythrobacter crassostreae]|uniref:Uncharacterized protein n=1 Tax=Erythrobacter crassostreae TaxID=2828328 RepID=A0A9X1F0E8_9SPHN|nr:hypothetical protein [Erythrobacter crassostrea]MBV7258046.1 hypothetical protein [Erythrobacter crassostrea]